MKIFSKNKEYLPFESSQKKYYVFSLCWMVKKYTPQGKKYSILGFTIYEQSFINCETDIRIFGIKVYHNNILSIKLRNNSLILFFDHSLGGGANVYFDIEKEKLIHEGYIVRVRYVPFFYNFNVEIYYEKDRYEKYTLHEKDLLEFLAKLHYKKIIVSELVSYDTVKILGVIRSLKGLTEETVFLCHDYQALCPSFTLMNDKEEYCGACTDIAKCEDCFSRLHLAPKELDNSILLSGAKSISIWRMAWGEFFQGVDKVIAFDESVEELFCRYYPCLHGKVEIRYHYIPFLRKVNFNKGKIVIAFIGNISSVAKGSRVVRYFDDRASEWPDVDFILVGRCAEKLTNIRTTGSYTRTELPDILEKYGVNMVFIPSVCPETFSYTTAEAMMMGLPIACFNYGAPAHRVSSYEKGLILDGTHLEMAVPRIVEFMDQHIFGRD